TLEAIAALKPSSCFACAERKSGSRYATLTGTPEVSMRTTVVWLVLIIGGAVLLPARVLPLAQARDAIALSGLVTSEEEGPMEGVLVSAKKSASTITITVVSDREGR